MQQQVKDQISFQYDKLTVQKYATVKSKNNLSCKKSTTTELNQKCNGKYKDQISFQCDHLPAQKHA